MEKMQQLDDKYAQALEMEHMKMFMFEREPSAGSGCGPVLEFIPLKKPAYTSSSESEEHQQDLNQPCVQDGSSGPDQISGKSGQKSDWLKSVQLWNQTSELPQKSGWCWSHDLHRRFLHSLQPLGGSHTATLKQIRELMKVDGLTNEEVKSNLQKYCLDTRMPSPPPSQNNASNGQALQFVVVGSIWVPPSDYTAMVQAPNGEASGAFNVPRVGVYTPMASPPAQPHHPWQQIQFS